MKTKAYKKGLVREVVWGVVKGLFFSAVIVIAAAWIYRQALAEALVFHGITQRTGLEAEVRHIDVDFQRGAFLVRDLRLLNPAGYEDPYLVEISAAFIDFDTGSFLRGDPRLHVVSLHIERLWIIRSEADRINLEVFEGGGTDIFVEEFRLAIDEIIYKDYAVVDEPITQHFPVRVRRVYRDIEGFQEIGNVLGVEALANTAIRRLIPWDPERFLQSNIFDPVTVANKMAVDAAGAVAGGVRDVVGRVMEVITSPFQRDG